MSISARFCTAALAAAVLPAVSPAFALTNGGFEDGFSNGVPVGWSTALSPTITQVTGLDGSATAVNLATPGAALLQDFENTPDIFTVGYDFELTAANTTDRALNVTLRQADGPNTPILNTRSLGSALQIFDGSAWQSICGISLATDTEYRLELDGTLGSAETAPGAGDAVNASYDLTLTELATSVETSVNGLSFFQNPTSGIEIDSIWFETGRIGSNSYTIDNVSVVVPEPATATLALGAAGLLLRRRR